MGTFGLVSLLVASGDAQPIDRTIDTGTTLFTGASTLNSPFPPSEPSAAFGVDLFEIDSGLVAIGSQGIDGTTASVVLVPETGAAVIADVVFAEKTVVAADDTLVVVDANRLRITTIAENGTLSEIANHQRSDGASFGRVAALGADTVAVTRELDDDRPALIEVFDLVDGVTPAVALAPGLERVSVAVDASGELVAVSGVRDQAEVGEVQFFRRSGEVWLVDARFEALGGGDVIASPTTPATFFVQRNGFFTQPTGTWSRITPDAAGALQPDREWSVQSASLAVTDGLAAFGLPDDEQVLTFTIDDPTAGERDPAVEDGAAPRATLRHAQNLYAPTPIPTDGTPARRRPPASQFGTSVAFSHGRLIVAGPGNEIGGVVDEGSLFVFDATSGPAGCTITGTDGDDTLNGTTADDVICGLGGNDLIRGNLGFDRIYGGPDDDDLSGDAADDLLVGGDGSDRIAGGAGDDALFGGPGRDQLYGGAGNDHLDGGADRDACDGGADFDTFDAC